GAEDAPRSLELLAQLEVVVDLAVDDDVQAPVRRGHGLRGRGGQIDDAQATMSQHHRIAARGRLAAPQSLAVRPAMAQLVQHRAHQAPGAVEISSYDAGYAAHGSVAYIRLCPPTSLMGRRTRRHRPAPRGSTTSPTRNA